MQITIVDVQTLATLRDAIMTEDAVAALDIVNRLMDDVAEQRLGDDRRQVVTLDLVPTGPAWEEDIIMPTQERDEF